MSGTNYETMVSQFHHYLENQDNYVNEYVGKAIVLHNFSVEGVYESEIDAAIVAIDTLEPGTFIVQLVTPGPDAYTVTISSQEILTIVP